MEGLGVAWPPNLKSVALHGAKPKFVSTLDLPSPPCSGGLEERTPVGLIVALFSSNSKPQTPNPINPKNPKTLNPINPINPKKP